MADDAEGPTVKSIIEFTVLGIVILAVLAWLGALGYVIVTGGP